MPSSLTEPAAGTLKRPGRRADAARVATTTPDAPEAYAAHLPALTRYCRSLVTDPQDAEDVAQEVMLKALAERPDPAIAAPWLFRVAHNTSISLLRSRRRRAAEPLEDVHVATTHDVEATSAIRGRMAELLDDLAALPDRQREALLLRELDGCSAKRIAALLGISTPAAQQAVLDARRSLAHCAEGRALACDGVQSWLSEHDWLRLRTRRVRAHLRDCATCTSFAERMGTRPADLRALLPHGGLLELLTRALLGGGATAKLAAGLAGVAVVGGGSAVVERPHAATTPVATPVAGYALTATPVARTTGTTGPTPEAAATSSPSPVRAAVRRQRAAGFGATTPRPAASRHPARSPGAAPGPAAASPHVAPPPTASDDRPAHDEASSPAATSAAPPVANDPPAPTPEPPAPPSPSVPHLPDTVAGTVSSAVAPAVGQTTAAAQALADDVTGTLGAVERTATSLLP